MLKGYLQGKTRVISNMNKVVLYTNENIDNSLMNLNQIVDDVPDAVNNFIKDGLFCLMMGIELTYPALLAIADKSYDDLVYNNITDELTQIDVKPEVLSKYIERMDFCRDTAALYTKNGNMAKTIARRYFEGRSDTTIMAMKDVLDTPLNEIEDTSVRIERHLYDTVHDIYRSPEND